LEAEVDEVEVPTPAVWITMVRSVARRSDERQDGWYPEVLGMAGKWWVIVVRRSWGLQTFEERRKKRRWKLARSLNLNLFFLCDAMS
jgi:hypothetical protein